MIEGLDRALADDTVADALSSAGWNAQRRVDVQRWMGWYADEGYDVSPYLKEIMRSFGGIRITPPVRPSAKFHSGPILFDPAWAATGESERIGERSHEVKKNLTPFAEWSEEYILLLTDDRQVYAETSYQLLFVANDFVEALTLLVTAHRPLVEV